MRWRIKAELKEERDAVDPTFEGLQEQSRPNITNELRKFIDVDNQGR